MAEHNRAWLECLKLHGDETEAKKHFKHAFDPKRPWDYVFHKALKDTEWWFEELGLPAFKGGSHQADIQGDAPVQRAQQGGKRGAAPQWVVPKTHQVIHQARLLLGQRKRCGRHEFTTCRMGTIQLPGQGCSFAGRSTPGIAPTPSATTNVPIIPIGFTCAQSACSQSTTRLSAMSRTFLLLHGPRQATQTVPARLARAKSRGSRVRASHLTERTTHRMMGLRIRRPLTFPLHTPQR